MKSLKRTLCLVLALVMVLGLFGIASATSFTDDNQVQYKEAVEVMTGIGAISGMGDGTFNPKGTITRAQAAKLVTFAVLGEASAKGLTGVTSSFTDVTVEGGFGWAIPSIEYLVKEGIINGRGDGTFDPNGQITGYEVGKMLLCALGYGKKGEYVGDQWTLNVAIDGARLGATTVTDHDDPTQVESLARLAVFSNRATDAAALSNPATREEVALYCFNTIQKQQVEYISTLDIYAGDGSNLGNHLGSIAETVYGGANGLLNAGTDETDPYGRPATKWMYKGETVSLAANKPILTYTTGVKSDALELAIKNAGYKLPASGEYVVSTNGDDAAAAALSATVGGNGILTEVYVKADKEVEKIVQVETSIGTVQKVTADDPKTTTVDERSLIIANTDGYFKASATDKTEGFDAVYAVAKTLSDAGELDKAAVLFVDDGTDTAAGNSAAAAIKTLSVSVPKTVETKVTSTKTATGGDIISFTSEAGNYELAEKATDEAKAIDVGNTATFILDNYGYVIHAGEASETAKSIGVVIEAGYGNDGFSDSYKLKIITLEGKEVVLPVASEKPFMKYDDGTSAWIVDSSITINKGNLPGFTGKGYIVTYEPDSDHEGAFIVKEASGVPADGHTNALKIVNKKVDLIVNSASVTKANEDTVFVIKTVDDKGVVTYTPYVGIDKVPTLDSAKKQLGEDPNKVTVATGDYTVMLNPKLAGYAAVVYVDGAELKDTDTTALSFIIVDPTKEIKRADGTVVYDGALITGGTYGDIQAVQVKKEGVLDDPTTSPTMLAQSYTLKDGVITAATAFTTPTTNAKPGTATGTVKAANGVITLGTTGHTYDPKCIVWEIDSTKTELTEKFVPKAVTGIATDNNDKVVFVEHPTTGTVSAIYILKQTGGEGEVPVRRYSVGFDTDGETGKTAKNSVFEASLASASAAAGDTVSVTITFKTKDASETATSATVALASKSNAVTISETASFTGADFAENKTKTITFTMPSKDVADLKITVS